MWLRSDLGISRSHDINTKDLRDKLEELVNDPEKDDLALCVFFIIVFMKVVLPSAATRVSREAAMFENVTFEDMAYMDYCQLMVDELRRAVVRYQDGVTLGKAITGCAIGPVLMYLDCLISGKALEVDLRTPRICFMDRDKLSDHADADLIKRGNADPKTWVFGKLLSGAVDTKVNNLSANKSKDFVDCDEAHLPMGDSHVNHGIRNVADVAADAAKMPDVDRKATVTGGADAGGIPCSSVRIVIDSVTDEYVTTKDLPLENFPLEGLSMVMHWKRLWCLAWKRCHPKMMI